MLLKKPSELVETVALAGIIYGQPGVGKSTLALSAPNPVMIDTDRGMRRVEKRFQTPSLQPTKYAEIIQLFEGNEVEAFDSIVFDTLGKLVDMMADHLCEINSKLKKGDGSLSMQGWGALKVEFQRLLRLAKQKNKHLVFVAHEREDKDGDIRIVRPDVSGSAGKDLVKDLDFMGYMEIRGNKRSISFNPSEKYYAKNSLRLPSVIDVPDTDKGNEFLASQIVTRSIEMMKEEDVRGAEYDALLNNLNTLIAAIATLKQADEALETLNMAPVIWDSQRVAKARLVERVKELGFIYDKQAKAFLATAPEDKAA